MNSKNKNVSFCDLINFKDQTNPQQVWPDKQFYRSKQRYFIEPTSSIQPIQYKLLNSALKRIRDDRKRLQQQAISDILSQQSSNFIFSRENTPANFVFPKKKTKHKTAASDLFDIASRGSQAVKQNDDIFENLILYPHLVGLSELVYSQVMGKDKKVNPKLINNWKECLLPEDKQQIYGANTPYTFSKIFPLNQLQRGFNEIYGTGKKRCLRVGEQSLLIYQMSKYLQKCTKDVKKIARKDYDIISDILKLSKLQQLDQLPICMKQAQLIWKILATQWRYSGNLDPINNKLLQSALINGKSNFLDLKKQNALTTFLLASSNLNQKQ